MRLLFPAFPPLGMTNGPPYPFVPPKKLVSPLAHQKNRDFFGGGFPENPEVPRGGYVGNWLIHHLQKFWKFIGDYTPFFRKNPRLSMMARSWEKQSPEKQEGHRKIADDFLANLR
jgi:hypothetical protein